MRPRQFNFQITDDMRADLEEIIRREKYTRPSMSELVRTMVAEGIERRKAKWRDESKGEEESPGGK